MADGRKRMKVLVLASAAVTVVTLAWGAGALRPASEVLQAIGRPADAGAEAKDESAGQLLADVDSFRNASASMPPQDAAKHWFGLLERAAKLGPVNPGDTAAYDFVIQAPVGEASILASLPPPAAWKALRAEAERRAGANPRPKALALRYLTEVLTSDRSKALNTLAEIEKELRQMDPEERQGIQSAIREARVLQARIYGSVEERLEAFQESLREAQEYKTTAIPDLVAMVGHERAAALLKDLAVSPALLTVEGGDATRSLVRKIAIDNVDRMRTPQWALVDSVEDAPLYEAISKRFPQPEPDSPAAAMFGWHWRPAAVYYFLAMVKNGNQSEAEQILVAIAGTQDVTIPREAVEALHRAHLNESLFRFLDGQLAKRPELRAWGVYIEQAAYTGHGADALALIDKLLARKDLAGFVRADLRARRVAALLAADEVDLALKGYRELLAVPPAKDEAGLDTRLGAALNAAAVGRLLGRKDMMALGLDFARRAADATGADENGSRFDAYRPVIAEMRRQGLNAEAQAIAIEELKRNRPSVEAYEGLMSAGTGSDVFALVELAGIYSAAGRHQDVVDLLKGSTRWGAADIGGIVGIPDTLNLPLGAIAARSLHAVGDKEAALRVARALVMTSPGRDAGYEIVAALDPDAANTFDSLYALDQFEERPLIWKARALLGGGKVDEAELVIRRAIAIDPSDGEEGPDDRMRAYSVLSEILARKNARKDADLFANAVAAIRLSEKGDALHAVGLYQRAFATYREALDLFSDAYCIQSRLAVQLNKQGRRKEALEHYRRAYQLMPDSFGRVESHCFGCENVFQDPEAQGIAEKVFTDVIRSSPGKAQAHYLLAYLRETQGDYAGAVQPLRSAVGIDGSYLNAWKRLHALGDKTYLESGERDIARLKLLELDPLARHSQYELADVGQLDALWNGAVRAEGVANKARPPRSGVYALTASEQIREKNLAKLPKEVQGQFAAMERMFGSAAGIAGGRGNPHKLLADHHLVRNAAQLMGVQSVGYDY